MLPRVIPIIIRIVIILLLLLLLLLILWWWLLLLIIVLVIAIAMSTTTHLLHGRTIASTIPCTPEIGIRILRIHPGPGTRINLQTQIQLFRSLRSGAGAFATDAAAPDDEPDDDRDESETADEDVRPAGEDFFFVHFLLFRGRDRGVFLLVGGEEGVGGVAGLVDAAHAHFDEIVVRGLFVGQGKELDERVVTVVLGMCDPVAVVHERVGVTH